MTTPSTPPTPSVTAAAQSSSDNDIRKSLTHYGLEEDHAPSLSAFLQLLQRWNQAYNLTAIRDPEQMRIQHLTDCIAIVPALRARLSTQGATRVLDVGSGGGLPGVVLAILQPTWRIDCVDAVGKKAAFVRQVGGALKLDGLRSIHSRVEDLQGEGYDLIICRAFSDLCSFVNLTRRLKKPSGLWAAMKGKLPEEEIRNLPVDVHAREVIAVDVDGSSSTRNLIIIESKR